VTLNFAEELVGKSTHFSSFKKNISNQKKWVMFQKTSYFFQMIFLGERKTTVTIRKPLTEMSDSDEPASTVR